MGLIGGIKDIWRDVQAASQILSLVNDAPRIVFYAEDVETYNQFEGTLDVLRTEHEILYITSAKDDPLLVQPPKNLRAFHVSRSLASLLPRINSGVFVTTMPDLGRLHVGRPGSGCRLVYLFHSLNSIHEVYLEGAFDHYDVFCCTGPHHERELRRQFDKRDLPQPELHRCGYYKLDRIAERFQSFERKNLESDVILLAPSWGRGNLLEAHGSTIVGELAQLPNTQVIVRPHPCFFKSIYPQGSGVVNQLIEQFDTLENVTFELDTRTEDSFYEADLMISDYSGAAYEYALGTLRPVLFIDGPRKTRNANWQDLGLPTFEDVMRFDVGEVLTGDVRSQVRKLASQLLSRRDSYREKLSRLRSSSVYQFGDSARSTAATVAEQLACALV